MNKMSTRDSDFFHPQNYYLTGPDETSVWKMWEDLRHEDIQPAIAEIDDPHHADEFADFCTGVADTLKDGLTLGEIFPEQARARA